MTDAASCPPEGEHPEPRLHLVETPSPDRAFFDVGIEDLPDVEKIDLTPYRVGAIGSKKPFDAQQVTAFVMGAAAGEGLKDSFDDKLSRALGALLKGISDKDEMGTLNTLLLENYETIDQEYPRLMPLLDRLRNEVLPTEQFVTVNKLCMLVAIIK